MKWFALFILLYMVCILLAIGCTRHCDIEEKSVCQCKSFSFPHYDYSDNFNINKWVSIHYCVCSCK